MRAHWTACSGLLSALLLAIAAARGQEFSAEVVTAGPKGAGATRPRIYVPKGKMRIESEVPGGKNAASVVLVDAARQKAYLLVPDQKTYVEANAFGAVFTSGLRLLQTVDPNHPCAGFKEYLEERSCRRSGFEIVNGRKADKWEVNSLRGGKQSLWVDPKLAFVIKMQDEEGVTELRSIREGPQPPSLFELPLDYRKISAASMKQESRLGHIAVAAEPTRRPTICLDFARGGRCALAAKRL